MIARESSAWSNYTRHVLLWEGKTSKDPDDITAAKCVSPGMIHTNKGVTYCTFKSMAAGLGISPVTHARFLKLSDEEVGRFIYEFYKKSKPELLPDTIAIAMTEARWLSGSRSIEHLQKVLGLPQTGILDSKTIAAANASDEEKLYHDYMTERSRYLNALSSKAKYKKWRNGWNNRLNAFMALPFLAKKKVRSSKSSPIIDAFDFGRWIRNNPI